MKHKLRFDKANYLRLRELGSKFNLSFSGFVSLGNKIIGLDVIKRKLLIAEKHSGLFRPYFIELSKLKAVTLQKIYNSIKAGELKKRRVEEFLQSVRLQLEFENGQDAIVLPFYEKRTDDFHDSRSLERKARNWQMMLSKLLHGEILNPLKKNDSWN